MSAISIKILNKLFTEYSRSLDKISIFVEGVFRQSFEEHLRDLFLNDGIDYNLFYTLKFANRMLTNFDIDIRVLLEEVVSTDEKVIEGRSTKY
jgi:hypothetical protein